MDLVLRGGNVIDGRGGPARRADVWIRGGTVIAVEPRIDVADARDVDVAGLHIAPGFIDIHTHSDYTLVYDGRALSKIRQGVTTEVIGNCGGFAAPAFGGGRTFAESHRERVGSDFQISWSSYAEYLRALDHGRLACNVVPLVGHGNLRACVIGLEDRRATSGDLDQMGRLLAECLDAGAFGMSTGLFYAPGSYSDTAEIASLAGVLAARGRIYASHIRDEGNNTIGVEAALAEAISIIETTGVRGQVSHLEAIGVPSWGKASRLLEMIDEAVGRGVNVAFDVNPYTTTGTHIDGALTPRWALEGGRDRLIERLNDPKDRARIKADYRTTVYERRGGPERILITASSDDPTLEGKTLDEVARERRSDPIDVLMEIAEKEDATLVSYSVSEDDARKIMRHPLAMISSDGWAVAADGPLSAGRQHPCDFGTYPRVIETYWRELQYWPIETAIAMCTSRPAAQLGLADRGVVRPGARADLVVLDLDRVRDRSSLFDPHQYPAGIVHVFVSGEAVVEEEEYTGATPGRVLRPS